MSGSARLKSIVSGSVGNVLEWFDFAIYGYFASVIGQNFFPSDDPTVSTVAAFGGFAAGYFVRPLGGAFFGHVADRFGTRIVLIWSVLLMGCASLLIALLPNYDAIGVWAPVLLVGLRMMQGFSVGGEFSGSVVYLVERAPRDRRGFVGSTATTGSVAGFVLGSGVAALLSSVLSDDQVASWGWRLPFILGSVVAVSALFLRRGTLEAESAPDGGHPHDELPLIKAFRDHWREILRLAGLVSCTNVAFYAMFVFAVDLMKSRFHVEASTSLDINTLNMAIMCLIILGAGWLSDRIGRKPLLFVESVGLVLLTVPLSTLMFHTEPAMIFLGQLGFALLVGIGLGLNPATVVENTEPQVRNTVISVGYNITLAVFGGTTPLVASWLLRETDNILSPELYIIFFGLVGLGATLTLRETRGCDLQKS